MIERNENSDLYVLADAFFDNLQIDNCEYGGIGLDSKRPFGNSDVEGDILTMLECEAEGDDGHSACWSYEQLSYARTLYHEKLIPFLQTRWKEFWKMKEES